MIIQDFSKLTPNFDNGTTKWYKHNGLQHFIENSQKENLPALSGLGCFNVVGKDVNDIVLINNKQEILANFNNHMEGYDQMYARISMMKINKHYDKHDL